MSRLSPEFSKYVKCPIRYTFQNKVPLLIFKQDRKVNLVFKCPTETSRKYEKVFEYVHNPDDEMYQVTCSIRLTIRLNNKLKYLQYKNLVLFCFRLEGLGIFPST